MRTWTPEQRLKQTALIRTWQPWKKSTGAKSAAGKEKSKMNALKHGMRGAIFRELEATFAEHNRTLKAVVCE